MFNGNTLNNMENQGSGIRDQGLGIRETSTTSPFTVRTHTKKPPVLDKGGLGFLGFRP